MCKPNLFEIAVTITPETAASYIANQKVEALQLTNMMGLLSLYWEIYLSLTDDVTKRLEGLSLRSVP